MATDEGDEARRAHVQTYVPTYQKAVWDDHADELGMNTAEYVRTMVQAGRRGFTGVEDADDHAEPEEPSGTRSSDDDPGGRRLEERVLAILEDGSCYDWDELVTELTDDLEERLEETLQRLQSEDEVVYSGRNGGYTLA